MQRYKLKNIINKYKEFSNKPVGEPYDLFVNSLPSELDYYKDGGKYRLKAAWKAYGEPKNYQESLWTGLVETIGDKFSMPSIGWNEENQSYEYLNLGKENDVVAKDIRAWDNDVIPFIKELKLGGYVRTFNEEENFWTYSKNTQKTLLEVIEEFKSGGQILQNVIPEGALHCRKNNLEGAGENFTAKGIPVMSNDGEQVAEIEKEEIIFCKRVTNKLEEAYKKFNSDETSNNEKEEIAIKIGKFLTKEILENTDDRTNLIEDVELKM